MASIKRCKTPFALEIDGLTRVISAGEVVSTDDPCYNTSTAELFEDVDVYVEQKTKRQAAAASGKTVEAMSSAPGEKRQIPAMPSRTTEKDTK